MIEPGAPRDFTGGRAVGLLAQLASEGAIAAPDAASAVRVLSERLSEAA